MPDVTPNLRADSSPLRVISFGAHLELQMPNSGALDGAIARMPPERERSSVEGHEEQRYLVRQSEGSTDCWDVVVSGQLSHRSDGWRLLRHVLEGDMHMYVAEFA